MQITSMFQIHAKDNASADVMIGLLTEQIYEAEAEFQKSKRRELRLKLIHYLVRRRHYLNYLSKTNTERYKSVLEKIELMRK